MSSPQSTESRYLTFARTLKLEPYIFLFMLGATVRSITVTQLFQDKLCVLDYGYSRTFCKDLTGDDSLSKLRKSEVLAETSIYLIYQNIVSNLPITITALFVGCWLDKHKNALKLLLVLATIGSIVEVALLILNVFQFHWNAKLLLPAFIPNALCGSSVYVLMGAYSYIPRTSKERLRPIRYAVLGLAIFLGSIAGTYIGGLLIKTTPISTQSLHNYTAVFLFSIVCYIPAAVWILYILGPNKRTTKIEIQIEGDTHDIIETPATATEDDEINEKWYTCLKYLFEWQNVKETLYTLFKHRPNNGRSLLWMAMISYFLIDMTTKGQDGVLFPFVQRVYDWDATTYSSVNSTATAISSGLACYIIFKLIRKFKVRDTILGILGVVSSLLMLIARGSILSPTGYYISVGVGSLAGLSSIAFQSLLSRLVPKDELSKIFCVIAAIQATVEIIGQILFNSTFSLTIENLPGLVFQLFSIPMFVPLIVSIVIDIIFTARDHNREPGIEEPQNKSPIDTDEDLNTRMSDNTQKNFGTFTST